METALADDRGEIHVLELTGTITPSEEGTYIKIPFTVPSSTGALEIEFEYEGRRIHSEIEIGLFDPNGFRGTSRFSKSRFYLSRHRTTPSYFPGPVEPGEWHVSLGFPTIRQESAYRVKITMIPKSHPVYTGPDSESLQDSLKWYKGDFHTHTGHSDAFGCHDTRGLRSPCQVYQVAEASHRNGLDFVSINDHNTVSHHQDIFTIQPTFPDLLLIRGQEVTTFFGHMNVIGTSEPVDFRIGYENYTVSDIQALSRDLGSLFVIAHPGRETGPSCTGCGWSAENTNFDLVDAIEIVNGTNVETAIAGIPFWHERLNEGYRITGIGGSDDHGAGFGRAQPGTPTTMVYAASLSEKDLIDSVRKGRVYLKTRAPEGPEIRFYATMGDKRWEMGDEIRSKELTEKEIKFFIEYSHFEENEVELIINGELVNHSLIDRNPSGHFATKEFSHPANETGWIRFNLRDPEGITVISNPIYIR